VTSAQTARASAGPDRELPPRRQRNARGQGVRLTQDIVTGALELIDRTGTAESVTLRAVAREIGIAAPSIYSHFADRDAILLAVVARLFDDLSAAIEAAKELAPDDPVERLVAGCAGYVGWGLGNPARYFVLFQSRWADAPGVSAYCEPVTIGPDGPPVPELGAEAFSKLVDGIAACVQAGVSASTDVVADGTAVWVALHGAVTLRTALPRFPWPEPVSKFVRQLVLQLAKVTVPA
jgi:AcrR family transcriptional regulator